MEYEAAFSAHHEIPILTALACFFVPSHKERNISLIFFYMCPVFNDFFLSSRRSTVLITCDMAHILSGIQRISKSVKYFNVS